LSAGKALITTHNDEESTMHIEPYLFFNGHCDEAIEFYRRALGAEVTMLMRFKESPDAGQIPPGSDDKVMHASLRIGDTTVLVSDGHSTGKPDFQGFALSITLPDEGKSSATLPRWPTGGRSRCRWPRPSFPRASAWSPTGSA
jgi:PhnB protein